MSMVDGIDATRTQETGATTLRIAVGAARDDVDVTLRVRRGSCWATMLGDFPLPADDALEQLASLMESRTATPERIEIHGAPAQALLPVLWLRTIWLGPEARIELVWSEVTPPAPGDDAGERLCATMCAGLVDRVRCIDADASMALWGIAPGPREPMGERVFDVVEALVDAWHARTHRAGGAAPEEWSIRMRRALDGCAARGARRIAIYGAGTHTRALGSVLCEPPVEILCVIDDAAGGRGRRLWNYPIVTLDEARAMQPDAVVLSANSIEDKLWANAAPLRDAGIEVVRLYGESAPSAEANADAPAPNEHAITILPGTRERTMTAPVLNLCFPAPGCAPFWQGLDAALGARGSGLINVFASPDGATGQGVVGDMTDLAALGARWPTHAPLGEPRAPRCLRAASPMSGVGAPPSAKASSRSSGADSARPTGWSIRPSSTSAPAWRWSGTASPGSPPRRCGRCAAVASASSSPSAAPSRRASSSIASASAASAR